MNDNQAYIGDCVDTLVEQLKRERDEREQIARNLYAQLKKIYATAQEAFPKMTDANLDSLPVFHPWIES